jgi:hypothetical protein
VQASSVMLRHANRRDAIRKDVLCDDVPASGPVGFGVLTQCRSREGTGWWIYIPDRELENLFVVQDLSGFYITWVNRFAVQSRHQYISFRSDRPPIKTASRKIPRFGYCAGVRSEAP